MSKNNDPRNMFVDNRQGYTQQDEPSGSPTATPQEDTASSSGGTQSKSYDERVEEMKRLAAKYQREGEGQLVKDIINNVIEQKAAGKLSNEQLVQFANRVAPLLNGEQKQRLSELLSQLLKL